VIHEAALALLSEQVDHLKELSEALGITDVRHQGFVVFADFIRRRNGKQYTLRFDCEGWPTQSASVHFVDPRTGEDSGPEVWASDGEQGIKVTSNPRFICLPGIREYHERHGPIQPNIHSNALSAVFHEIVQCIEARG
jgi:hypothetical protein